MGTPDERRKESEILLSWIIDRYGSQIHPDMMDGLRAAVETVVKTVIPLRNVKLENSDAPLPPFIPFRKEG